MIPTSAPLSEITEFILDGTHGSPSRTEAGIPVLSAQHVKDGYLSYDTDRFTSQAEYDSFVRRVSIKPGDLLLTIVGTIGRSAIVTHVEPAVFQRSVAILRFRPSLVDSRYAFHITKGQNFKSQLSKYSNQSAQAGVYLGKLGLVEIPVPPLGEQKRIAAILDKADTLLRKRKRATDLIEQGRDSLIELSLSQANVEVEALKGHLEFITTGGRNWSQYYSKDGHRFIRSLDVQMNSISDEDPAYVTPPQNAEARRTRTQEGDVLLTVTGSRIGRVAELPASLNGSYVSQHVAILRVNRERLRPKFLSFFLSSQSGQRQIQKWQYGQTKPGLNFRQIEDFLIPSITIDRQIRLERAIERFEATLGAQEAHGARLTHLFSSLEHRAFSGQL